MKPRMKLRHRRLVVVLTIAMLGVAACGRHEVSTTPAPKPAQVDAIEGSDLHRVTLTDQAMQQLGIRSEPVRAAPPAGAVASTLTVIPVAAVIYDPQGRSWTYVVADHTFVRQAIVVDHIAGADAFLRSGPAVGSPVVTVGAPELLGTEYGVGEE